MPSCSGAQTVLEFNILANLDEISLRKVKISDKTLISGWTCKNLKYLSNQIFLSKMNSRFVISVKNWTRKHLFQKNLMIKKFLIVWPAILHNRPHTLCRPTEADRARARGGIRGWLVLRPRGFRARSFGIWIFIERDTDAWKIKFGFVTEISKFSIQIKNIALTWRDIRELPGPP